MTADKTLLMSLKGNLIIGVKTTHEFNMVDLVRIKKALVNGVYDRAYDMNNDGVLTQEDYTILENIVMENLFG